MALTFIDTNSIPRAPMREGEAAEILNENLCGAKNVVGTLRWLTSGEKYVTKKSKKHQLIYLMEGNATIELEGKNYDVVKGAGVYLGPSETASIQAGESAKLFHLVTPVIPK